MEVEEVFEALNGDTSAEVTKGKSSSRYMECNRPLAEELEKILGDYENDCKVTYANLNDVVMRVPDIKQKWITRMIRYRRSLSEAKNMLEKVMKEAVKNVREESRIEMSPASATKQINADIEKFPKVAAMKERVELYEKIFDDVSNIVNDHIKFFNQEIHTIVEFYKMENS